MWDQEYLQEIIKFKTDLRIYKETDDNLDNGKSFHGASNCNNILEKPSASFGNLWGGGLD